MLLPLCSQLRTSFVSAVFDFSASPNDAAPLSLMLLPVDSMRMEKSGLVGAICVLFLLSLQLIWSSVSVVFDFNASTNDVAPASSILFPVDLIGMKREWIVDECHLCVASFVFTIQIDLSDCFV